MEMIQMSFGLKQIPRTLYSPKSAFKKIKKDSSVTTGLLIAIILISLGSLASYGMSGNIERMMETAVEEGQLPEEASQGMEEDQETYLTLNQIIMSIPITVVLFLVSIVIAGWMASAWDRKKFKMDKNVAVLGYSPLIDLIQSFTLSLTAFLMIDSGTTGLGIIGLLFIIFLVWEIWIKGTGIAVANNTSLLKGIVSWIVAVIIIGLITFFLALGTL